MLWRCFLVGLGKADRNVYGDKVLKRDSFTYIVYKNVLWWTEYFQNADASQGNDFVKLTDIFLVITFSSNKLQINICLLATQPKTIFWWHFKKRSQGDTRNELIMFNVYLIPRTKLLVEAMAYHLNIMSNHYHCELINNENKPHKWYKHTSTHRNSCDLLN